MSDQLIVEREGLEKKDKSELQAIVQALGGSSSARMRKSDLIDKILDLSGASANAAASADRGRASGSGSDSPAGRGSGAAGLADGADTADGPETADGADPGDDAADDAATADRSMSKAETGAGKRSTGKSGGSAEAETESGGDRAASDDAGSGDSGSDDADAENHPVGPDGEPLADWEIKVLQEGGQLEKGQSRRNRGKNQRGGEKNAQQAEKNGEATDEVDPNNRRSRRRGRGRGRDRDDAGNDPISNDPIEVSGYLDLRDEGYAFLRVNGALPSRDDAYVSVKQVRQYGLRKGDHLVGLSRPANRNEKNPALQQLNRINGNPPEQSKGRARFDKLTPLFPDERLVLECKDEPLNMTTRIIDLVAPIGKGQRGLIVSPPKAGKTSIMKNIARAIETNNPEVSLIVLLIDERPEEVTDMERHLKNGEVVSSTFDRPPEEHCAVAELTLERAKRMVEDGKDVVVILDGITRLARAYNMSAPQSGRVLSGGVDAAALYPPKRFLGAARNLEEGGSLTMLATALVETGSRMDEVIFEEFKGTGNMELRLDRKLAEKRIFPAIDIDASSTRNEELLRPRKEVEASWKLRRVVSGMNDDGGSGAAGVEMLVERLMSFKTNADFLSEISKTR
ncbi:MAG: transcription termination factor Rho [Acidimicrobiales bacterium]